MERHSRRGRRDRGPGRALITGAIAALVFAVPGRHPLILLLRVWNGGEMLVLSLYFQQVLHDSPLMTGLAIAPRGIVGFAAGALGARLAARMGTRWLFVLNMTSEHD
jgi:hypothetical protein